MKVYGLYGKSGTGKSFHAIGLARELGCDSLIDDGLFIHENAVLAGISAKRQKTKVGAIKTALFTDDAHAEAVRQSIRETNPEGVLVLGTSVEMIAKITERLGLPEAERLVSIEEITTEKEREAALRMREGKGTHVIPVPTFQIKRQFSGYFMDPFSLFRDLVPGKGRTEGEKTLVRPTFSYLGDYKIGDTVFLDIAGYVGKKTAGIRRVTRILITPEADSVAISLVVQTEPGIRIPAVCGKLARDVRIEIEHMTQFNISRVNVEVRAGK